MSRRKLIDFGQLEKDQALLQMRRIKTDQRVRLALDTEAAIQLVTEWKTTEKVPQGMNLAAMQALFAISLIRRNVEAALRGKQDQTHSNGHAPASHPIANDTLLTPEQIHERNEATRRYREFMQKLIDIVTNPEELQAWAFFQNRLSSPPPESTLRKIAAIRYVASRIPGGPAILQAQRRNVRWGDLTRTVSHDPHSAEFADVVKAADQCAIEVGLNMRFDPSGPAEGRPQDSFLNDCTETVRQTLLESGLAEDLKRYYEKFTCGSNVRLSQAVAQQYARAVDTLRHSDPQGLAALRKHFRTLPWDFVDDFTQEGPFIEPKTSLENAPQPPTVSATERFIEMGRHAQAHRTLPEDATINRLPDETAAEIGGPEPEPAAQPTLDELMRTHKETQYDAEEKERMAQVMQTEDGLMSHILAVDGLLDGPSIPPDVKQRVMFHMQAYAAKLVDAVALHGRESLEMYFHLSEGATPDVQEAIMPAIETARTEVVAIMEKAVAEPQTAITLVPLEEHDPRLADFLPILAKLEEARRQECEALLRTLKPATERTRGRVPDQYREICFQLIDALHGACDPQMLFDYMKVTGDQVRGWRREAVEKKAFPTAPAAATPQELLDAVTNDHRAEVEAILPFLEHAAARSRGRISADNQRRVARMLELLPAEAAASFLAYVKVQTENVDAWRKEWATLDNPQATVATKIMEAAEPLQGEAINKREATPRKRQKFRLADLWINFRAAKNNQPSADTLSGKELNSMSESETAIASECEPSIGMTAERESVPTNAEPVFTEKEPVVTPDNTTTQEDHVAIVNAAFSTYPYLQKITDAPVQAECLSLLQSLQLPPKQPGKNRKLDDNTKKTIIRVADMLAGYRAVSAFLKSIDIADANITNWRAQLNLEPRTPLSEANGQAEPSAASEQNASHDENGHTPAPQVKTARATAALRLPPENRQVTFVNASLAPRPKSAADTFDETAGDGRDRATRLAIVQGALARKNDPAERDRWYATHGVTGSDVLRWIRVYDGIVTHKKDVPGEKKKPAENSALLRFKPGNHFDTIESFVNDIAVILLNPFDNVTEFTTTNDRDVMGPMENRERHRRLVADTMNPLSEEEIRTLRSIAQTRPEDFELNAMDTWCDGIAKRFGLPKNIDTKEFALALLEAMRDPRQQAQMKEAAMSAFS